MSIYPSGIDSFTTKANGTDDVLADYVNALQNSVTNIENFLGLQTGNSFLTGVSYFTESQLITGTTNQAPYYLNLSHTPLSTPQCTVLYSGTNNTLDLYLKYICTSRAANTPGIVYALASTGTSSAVSALVMVSGSYFYPLLENSALLAGSDCIKNSWDGNTLYFGSAGGGGVMKFSIPQGTINLITGVSSNGFDVDISGNLYWGYNYSTNAIIYRTDPSGNTITIAGTGKANTTGTVGPGQTPYNGVVATGIAIGVPNQISCDRAGTVYTYSSATTTQLYKVDTTGLLWTVAGSGASGYTGDNGSAAIAKVDPTFLDVDLSSNVYFYQGSSNVMRRVDAKTNIITTTAGNTVSSCLLSQIPRTGSVFFSTNSMSIDVSGNIYYVQAASTCGNNLLKYLDPINANPLPIIRYPRAEFTNIPVKMLVNPSGIWPVAKYDTETASNMNNMTTSLALTSTVNTNNYIVGLFSGTSTIGIFTRPTLSASTPNPYSITATYLAKINP